MARRSITGEQAEQVLRDLAYKPLEPYPGVVQAPWKAQCVVCGMVRRLYLHNLRSLGKPCGHSGSAQDADKEMRAAGYVPAVPYPGNTNTPWLVRCTVCGQDRRPTLSKVRQGRRCNHRVGRTPRPAPTDWS